MRKLTAKQNKFIDGVVSGLSRSEAYRQAYDAKNMSVEVIAVKAFNLANQDNIRASILANWDDIRAIIDQRVRDRW